MTVGRIRPALRLLALGAAVWQAITGRHVYLSTGCLHGDCGYCAAAAGKTGTKRPGECKWGDARCIHRCHRRPARHR